MSTSPAPPSIEDAAAAMTVSELMDSVKHLRRSAKGLPAALGERLLADAAALEAEMAKKLLIKKAEVSCSPVASELIAQFFALTATNQLDQLSLLSNERGVLHCELSFFLPKTDVPKLLIRRGPDLDDVLMRLHFALVEGHGPTVANATAWLAQAERLQRFLRIGQANSVYTSFGWGTSWCSPRMTVRLGNKRRSIPRGSANGVKSEVAWVEDGLAKLETLSGLAKT